MMPNGNIQEKGKVIFLGLIRSCVMLIKRHAQVWVVLKSISVPQMEKYIGFGCYASKGCRTH